MSGNIVMIPELRNILLQQPTAGRTVTHIQQRVAAEYGLTRADLLLRRRNLERVVPRQLAMYLTRRLTDESLPAIARAFERDHTTVLHAVRTVEKMLDCDPEWAGEVRALREELKRELGGLKWFDILIEDRLAMIRRRLRDLAKQDAELFLKRLGEIAGVTFTKPGGNRP